MKGWTQTGSSETILRFGKQIDESTWFFYQWKDNNLSEITINLKDNRYSEISDALFSCGYQIFIYSFPDEDFEFIIWNENGKKDMQESVEIACECMVKKLNNE